MRWALDYLTAEEIRALREAAESLKRDLKYEKRQDTGRKQNRRTKGIKWAARA